MQQSPVETGSVSSMKEESMSTEPRKGNMRLAASSIAGLRSFRGMSVLTCRQQPVLTSQGSFLRSATVAKTAW